MSTTRSSGSTRYTPETFPTYPGGSSAAATNAGFGDTFGTPAAPPQDFNAARLAELQANPSLDPTPKGPDPFAGFGGTIPPGFGANNTQAQPFGAANFFGAGPGFSGIGGLGSLLGNMPGLSPFTMMGADFGRAQRANQYYQQMAALERLGLAPRGFAQGLGQQGALGALSVLNGPFGMFGGGFPGGGYGGGGYGDETIYQKAARTGGYVVTPITGPSFIQYPEDSNYGGYGGGYPAPPSPQTSYQRGTTRSRTAPSSAPTATNMSTGANTTYGGTSGTIAGNVPENLLPPPPPGMHYIRGALGMGDWQLVPVGVLS